LEHDHGSDRAAKGKTLNKAKLEQLPVALPPIEEQRRIMVILDKADAIRSKKRQTITLSNRLIESGFLHFFGDCLNNGKRFPAGTLEQLAGRIVDCPHSTPEYSATETAYFCVRSSDIQDAQINLSQTRFVTSEIYEERVARHVPQAGEVIYTREGGRLGNAAQIPRDVNICLGQRMMLFSAKDKVSTNEFIWALLNSPGIRHQVDSLIAGAAAPRVNIADIRRLEVILPSFELQQQFSRFVQKVRDQRMKSSKSEEELGDLFNSLVQRAFRGEL
jgi:type I restriction enzyme S subunit